MRDSIRLPGPDGASTIFRRDEQRIWLERLCGMPCAVMPASDWPPGHGLIELATRSGRCEGHDLALIEAGLDNGHGRIMWQAGGGAMVWESTWSVCGRTGVVSRQDVLHNAGQDSITLLRCQARFVFPPATWEVYAQQSHWCSENQGAWLPLHAGGLHLGCVGGRTTQDGTP